jgi:hypothetical protein
MNPSYARAARSIAGLRREYELLLPYRDHHSAFARALDACELMFETFEILGRIYQRDEAELRIWEDAFRRVLTERRAALRGQGRALAAIQRRQR